MSDSTTVRCDECGGEMRIGDWPFCKGDQSAHVPAENFGYDSLDYYDVQLLPTGHPAKNAIDPVTGMRAVHIQSRGERQRLMKEQGVQFGTQKFDRQVGKQYYT